MKIYKDWLGKTHIELHNRKIEVLNTYFEKSFEMFKDMLAKPSIDKCSTDEFRDYKLTVERNNHGFLFTFVKAIHIPSESSGLNKIEYDYECFLVDYSNVHDFNKQVKSNVMIKNER